MANTCLIFSIPDLLTHSFIQPIHIYLHAQDVTHPIMLVFLIKIFFLYPSTTSSSHALASSTSWLSISPSSSSSESTCASPTYTASCRAETIFFYLIQLSQIDPQKLKSCVCDLRNGIRAIDILFKSGCKI